MVRAFLSPGGRRLPRCLLPPLRHPLGSHRVPLRLEHDDGPRPGASHLRDANPGPLARPGHRPGGMDRPLFGPKGHMSCSPSSSRRRPSTSGGWSWSGSSPRLPGGLDRRQRRSAQQSCPPDRPRPARRLTGSEVTGRARHGARPSTRAGRAARRRFARAGPCRARCWPRSGSEKLSRRKPWFGGADEEAAPRDHSHRVLDGRAEDLVVAHPGGSSSQRKRPPSGVDQRVPAGMLRSSAREHRLAALAVLRADPPEVRLVVEGLQQLRHRVLGEGGGVEVAGLLGDGQRTDQRLRARGPSRGAARARASWRRCRGGR